MTGLRHFGAVALGCLLLVVLCGCSDAGLLRPEDADLSGDWSGNSGDVELSLVLSESDGGSLTGSGSLDAGFGTSFSVSSGSRDGATFTMTLDPVGFEDITYDGRVEVTDPKAGTVELRGTMNGAGFEDFSMTLTR